MSSPSNYSKTASESREALMQAIARACKLWAPPPVMTVSQWADAERRLSAESAAQPGRYYTSRTEYARGIMDALSDPKVKRVVGMTSSQIGKSSVLENIIGYHMHHDPCPMMLVMPTQHLCEEFSKDRLTPMLRDTPALRGLVRESNARKSGNTLLSKHFPGGLLVMGWPTSPATLAGRPIRIAVGDELDRWKLETKEGDPVGLFSKRTTAFWNAKEAYFSSPTIAGVSIIEGLYLESDQRRYYIPCPHCSETFVLEFDHLKWEEADPVPKPDGTMMRHPKDAWFECPACAGRISEVQRNRAVRAGEWRAHAPFRGSAGFWVWEGYSPFSSALKIAKEWLSVQGDQAKTIRFWNTTAGQVWHEKGEAPAWEKVAARRERYKPGTVPAGALLLTAGVDVQGDRIEVSVWGWGKNRHCWLVEHTVLPGRPEEERVWAELSSLVEQVWTHDSGAQMSLSRIAIDSGHAATRVYAWARKVGPSRVIVVKGFDNLGGVIVGQPSAVDATSHGKKLNRGVKIWPVDVSKLKSELYGRLRLDFPEEGGDLPAGWVHLHEVPDEFCRQMVAEVLINRKNPRTGLHKLEWKKDRERNEALDCWNYARAAAHVVGIDRLSDRQWANLSFALGVPPEVPVLVAPVGTSTSVPAPAPPPPPPPPTPARVAPKQNSWLSGRSGGGWSKGWR